MVIASIADNDNVPYCRAVVFPAIKSNLDYR